MQHPSMPKAALLLLRRLARVTGIERVGRRGDPYSRFDRVPRCGGYNELFVVSRRDSSSMKG